MLALCLSFLIVAAGTKQCQEADGTCQVATNLDDLGIPYLSYLRPSPVRTQRPMGAKFRNFKTYDLEMYWDDGSPRGQYSGLISKLSGSSTLTYETHRFKFYKQGGPYDKPLAVLTMTEGKYIYVVPPDPKDDFVSDLDFYKKTMEEMNFHATYYAKHRAPWLAYYPRGPPILHIWPADYLGQIHSVESKSGYLDCNLKSKGCTAPTSTIHLKLVSLKPRVFLIENLLSEFEVAHVLELGKKTVSRSTVGNGKGAYTSNTRTSRTGWLRRNVSPTLNHVFKRFADVLNISDHQLQHHKNAENLQIVHYREGQQYTPHHDFGDDGNGPAARFLTLFFYIQPAEAGGGTSFPKAYGGRGMKVLPPKAGSALLWYNMLPDGNGDDFSLHAGMPVEKGEKWGANLWVWDPHRR